jgi:membrane carboxypeptidase/penicillin-binding protein
MTAALQAHPEWAGDWQMPAGVEQVEIDAETGALPSELTTAKRTELFITGTAPTAPSEDAPEDTDPLGDEIEGGDDALPQGTPYAIEVPPLPEATPPSSRPRAAPGDDRPGSTQERDPTRLTGTVTLDIDPTTGLLAAETCPVIRTRTFQIGTEPRRRCGPQFHTGRDIIPSETRPRRVSP